MKFVIKNSGLVLAGLKIGFTARSLSLLFMLLLFTAEPMAAQEIAPIKSLGRQQYELMLQQKAKAKEVLLKQQYATTFADARFGHYAEMVKLMTGTHQTGLIKDLMNANPGHEIEVQKFVTPYVTTYFQNMLFEIPKRVFLHEIVPLDSLEDLKIKAAMATSTAQQNYDHFETEFYQQNIDLGGKIIA